MYVEYGPGPCGFTSRWEGRPCTPEFNWGDDGVVLPAHDLWLDQLDLVHENLDALVDKEVKSLSPENLPKDLAAVKALLKEHAGSLQASFLQFECQVSCLAASWCPREGTLAPGLLTEGEHFSQHVAELYLCGAN